MSWQRFRWYRWLKGGRWALMDGYWYRVPADGRIYENGRSFCWTYLGIEEREDYDKHPSITWCGIIPLTRDRSVAVIFGITSWYWFRTTIGRDSAGDKVRESHLVSLTVRDRPSGRFITACLLPFMLQVAWVRKPVK
jgi:hypothetical protein